PGSPPKDKKGKGKEKEKQQDFDELEASLRRFVLEKRARSKLAPAKTYLMNVLGDLGTLASVNKDVAQNEYDRVTKELQDLEPVFEKSKKARSQADEDVATQIETTGQEVYDLTRGRYNKDDNVNLFLSCKDSSGLERVVVEAGCINERDVNDAVGRPDMCFRRFGCRQSRVGLREPLRLQYSRARPEPHRICLCMAVGPRAGSCGGAGRCRRWTFQR
ncbi:2643_t:CDS:2, partial [Scutellospora calospora]